MPKGIIRRTDTLRPKKPYTLGAIAVILVLSAVASYEVITSSAASYCPNEAIGQCRPYDTSSPWNTEIGSNPTISADSGKYMQAIKNNGTQLKSDPTQYTPIIIPVNNSTPKTTVMLLEGNYGWGNGFIYDRGDNIADKTSTPGNLYGSPQTISNVPIPSNMTPAQIPANDDAQVVFWNTDTGEEWAFWQFRPTSKYDNDPTNDNDLNAIDANTQSSNYTTETAKWAGTNLSKYHTKTDSLGNRYFGRLCGRSDEVNKCDIPTQVPGVGGRGAGTPYAAGLIRQWEVAAGNIEHALSFAYNYPCNQFVYPASKSDGSNSCAPVTIGGQPALHPPEGTRLQLDPSLTDQQLSQAPYNLTTPAQLTVAHAMQKYGMYIIDNSGRPKINLEYSSNPNWSSTTPLNENSFSGIPWTAFRVVSPPADPTTNPPPTKTGDLNNSNSVDIFDLSIILSNYGKSTSQASNASADINASGAIDGVDLSILLSNYGT